MLPMLTEWMCARYARFHVHEYNMGYSKHAVGYVEIEIIHIYITITIGILYLRSIYCPSMKRDSYQNITVYTYPG